MAQTKQEIADITVKSVLAGREDVSLVIHFSDDLYLDSVKHCDSKIGLANIHAYTDEKISEVREWNGLYISPGNILLPQVILISNRQVDKCFSYVSTVAHEVKHALNRTDFCMKYCEGNADAYFDHPLVGVYDVWDEYSARKIGHLTYLTKTLPVFNNYSGDEVRSLILKNDLPIRMQEINKIIHSEEDIYKRIEAVLGIIARMSIWRGLYNVNLQSLDHRFLKAMAVFDKYNTVEELQLEDIQGTILELKEQFSN